MECMTAVDMKDALVYGFKLLGYLLLVFIAGGILILIGASFVPSLRGGGNIILAAIFYIAGISVIYAGSLGMLYKVIGDGVEIGNIASRSGGGGAAASQPPQSPGRGGAAPQQAGQGRQRR